MTGERRERARETAMVSCERPRLLGDVRDTALVRIAEDRGRSIKSLILQGIDHVLENTRGQGGNNPNIPNRRPLCLRRVSSRSGTEPARFRFLDCSSSLKDHALQEARHGGKRKKRRLAKKLSMEGVAPAIIRGTQTISGPRALKQPGRIPNVEKAEHAQELPIIDRDTRE